MKEITRIHLARVAYDIEVAARKQLELYLNEVEKALQADDGTMAEIEARIVEILAEHGVRADDIVTASDVAAIKTQLGDPSEFVDDTTGEHEARQTSRRLLRSTDNAVIAGVCGGIGEYFGLHVTGLRWLTIGLTVITGGAFLVVYVALWIILRPAKTAADRLQLRGEAVTPSAMKQLVAQESLVAPESRRPAVVAIRTLLSIGFGLAALGAISVTVAAVIVRPSLFIGDHAYGYKGWIIAAGALAVIAGILFAVLMVVAAIVSARWKITRRSVIAAAVIIFAGLASFGFAVTVGGYSIGRANNALDTAVGNKLVTASVKSVALVKGKPLTIDSPLAMSGVEYHVTNSAPHATIQYYPGQQHPRISVSSDNTVMIKPDGACSGFLASYCQADTTVILYGPAVDSVIVTNGMVRYYAANQSKLAVQVQPNASLVIASGHIGSIKGSAKLSSTISVEDSASVDSVDLKMAASSYGSFTNLNDLTLQVPEMCRDDAVVIVDAQAMNRLMVNGQPTTVNTLDNQCLQLNQN